MLEVHADGSSRFHDDSRVFAYSSLLLQILLCFPDDDVSRSSLPIMSRRMRRLADAVTIGRAHGLMSATPGSALSF